MKCPLPVEQAKQIQTQRNGNAATTSIPVSPYAVDFSEEHQTKWAPSPFSCHLN